MNSDVRQILCEMHFERNRNCADLFSTYSHHRQIVTDLLIDAASESGHTLAVLGAGNSNDLDLPRLRRHFGRIVLVDIDAVALRRGLAQHQLTDADLGGVELMPGIDLAGLMEIVPIHGSLPLAPRDADDLINQLEGLGSHAGVVLPEQYGVVASTCLLSQIADSIIHLLGRDHPRLLSTILEVRRDHFRLLLESTLPGGAAVLVSDFVSSDTWPALLHIPEEKLHEACVEQLAFQNFLHGLNPFRFLQVPSESPKLADLCADIRLSRFWVWHLRTKAFAVCACIMKCRGGQLATT